MKNSKKEFCVKKAFFLMKHHESGIEFWKNSFVTGSKRIKINKIYCRFLWFVQYYTQKQYNTREVDTVGQLNYLRGIGSTVRANREPKKLLPEPTHVVSIIKSLRNCLSATKRRQRERADKWALRYIQLDDHILPALGPSKSRL